MPDKELKESVSTEQEESESSTSPKMSRKGLIITVSIVGLVLIGVLIGGGVWALNTIAQQSSRRAMPYFTNATSQHVNFRSPFGFGRAEQTQATDNTVTTTVYTYQSGVVVAVNSSNIVIAGNGKQTTIQTNSSTAYTNNQKPVVNDTVLVTGTTANNVTTATNIAVAD